MGLRWIVESEVVEEQERVEGFGTVGRDRAPQAHPCAFNDGGRFDET